jgi:hypothetical protein
MVWLATAESLLASATLKPDPVRKLYMELSKNVFLPKINMLIDIQSPLIITQMGSQLYGKNGLLSGDCFHIDINIKFKKSPCIT